ncbi:hypothetical protein [Erythrobacter sp.]|uniref:hypothetical protein n=1 Tax=Erythrobacter sp. TaxID=1042 RepID=UPI002EB9DE55|nr:hypothetical protein [Erythrobacter sp.]
MNARATGRDHADICSGRMPSGFAYGRALTSITALAMALTVPSLSLGAVGVTYFKPALPQPVAVIPLAPPHSAPGADWSLSLAPETTDPATPLAAPRLLAGFAPTASLAVSEQSAAPDPLPGMPLSPPEPALTERAARRIDVALPGPLTAPALEFEAPAPLTLPLPAQPPARIAALAAPRRAGLVAIEQITPAAALAHSQGSAESRADTNLEAVAEDRIKLAAEPMRLGELPKELLGGLSAQERDVLALAERQGADASRTEEAEDAPYPEAAAGSAEFAAALPEPAPGLAQSRLEQIELVSKTRLDARINGVLTGSVDFEQQDGTIAIRLRSVTELLRGRYSPEEYEALTASSAIDALVTLAELQNAGIPISYNPAFDEVNFGIDYEDATDAHKVQIDQVGAPTLGAERSAIDQIGG